MKNFKLSLTFFYLLIITHICTSKFLRKDIPRRRKGSSSRNKLDPRIIGGRPTHPGEFPYQLQLRYETHHSCGASLVIAPSTGKQIVITAGHCVNPSLISSYNIRAGSIYIDGSDAQTLKVKAAVVHPKYSNFRNDIAILFLDGEFKLNKNVQPVELPGGNEIVKKEITITGWGKTDPTQLVTWLPKRLQALVMPVVPNRKCLELWNKLTGFNGNIIVPTHLCAGNLEGSQASCNGDSGGPAVILDSKKRRKLVGLVSFGHSGCATKGYPSVFTRVSKYVKWINAVSKKFETEN